MKQEGGDWRVRALGPAGWVGRVGGGVLTQLLCLKVGGAAALAFTFTVDGGHLDLVVGLWPQTHDGEGGGVCEGREETD